MAELNQNKNSKQLDSTINKTFNTCSTESLFLKYNEISEQTEKIGGFLQC